jgi:hypothetical protein
MGQAREDVDVQALVADAGVERLDVAVAPRLAGRDEVQADSFAGSVGHRRRPSARRTGCATGSTSARRPAAPGRPQRCPRPLPASCRPARACGRPAPAYASSSLPRCCRAFLPTSWAARLSLDLDQPTGVRPTAVIVLARDAQTLPHMRNEGVVCSDTYAPTGILIRGAVGSTYLTSIRRGAAMEPEMIRVLPIMCLAGHDVHVTRALHLYRPVPGASSGPSTMC